MLLLDRDIVVVVVVVIIVFVARVDLVAVC